MTGDRLEDELADRLRSAWKRRARPSLRRLLLRRRSAEQVDAPEFRGILLSLFKLDLQFRAQAGLLSNEASAVADYVREFPKLTAADLDALARCESQWRETPQTVAEPAGQELQTGPSDTESGVPEIQGFSPLAFIGQGGLGIVYRAVQLGTNRKVAIKFIRPEFEMLDRSRSMFVREASIAVGLKHPRIVECLGFGFCGLRPYLVMEYLPSDDLEKLVWKHSQARRVRLAVKVVLRVLQALIYAHAAGIVHRDIKPQNILATIRGGRLQVKVADFGLAKMFETAGFSGITNSGEVCGTLPYMSLEQLHDSRSAKPECDIYATLVCLYRLLTEEFPHPESSPIATIYHRLHEDIRPPQDFNPEIPDELARILKRGLSRDGTKRFATAQSLHDALLDLSLLNR